MQLHFLRHGRTVSNHGPFISGQLNESLTSEGVEETLKLKSQLAQAGQSNFTKIYSSPALRTQETLSHLNLPTSIPVVLDPCLLEINAGDFSLKKWSEYFDLYPAGQDLKHSELSFPNGESYNDLFKRVESGLNRIIGCAKEKDSILVVAHGGSIVTALHILLKIPLVDFPAFKIENSSLTTLSKKKNDGWFCERTNFTA